MKRQHNNPQPLPKIINQQVSLLIKKIKKPQNKTPNPTKTKQTTTKKKT